jgi:hypothetical protein
MSSVRELLLDMDMELEDYTFEISKARNPSLTDEDRLSLIRSGEAAWKRLEAVHRELERKAATRTALRSQAFG